MLRAGGLVLLHEFYGSSHELPGLTVGQRQLLVRRALELDEPPLSPADEKLVD